MQEQQWQKLIRADIFTLDEYPPVEPTERIAKRLNIASNLIAKLDANECPYGTLPQVIDALQSYREYHIYPDPHQRTLRDALGNYLGLDAQSIVAGSGIDELLDYMCRMFINPGDAIVNIKPTFGMYAFDAQLVQGEVIQVTRNTNYEVDTRAVGKAISEWNSNRGSNNKTGRVKLLFVASPNNPTGNWLSDEQLNQLLSLDCVVILDEAYVEFSQYPSRVDWVSRHKNLIVFRTFSKAAGMAGLRLGYGVFPDWIVDQLWRFKQPYNINVAAAVAGIVSLAHFDKIEKIVELMKTERDRLFDSLCKIPYLQPFPSQSNFILCKVIGLSALDVKQRLEKRGILVRYYANQDLKDCIRISVGLPEHTDRLIAELKENTA
jgi:histidinol-phosphate aminotransferase